MPTFVRVAGYPGVHGCPDGATTSPVLFVHGAGGSAGQFVAWVEAFAAAGFEAYALSRRGRDGVRPSGAEGIHFRDYVDDTRAMIDALGEAVILIAHGLGGLVALKAAEEGGVGAVVLLASDAPGDLPDCLPPTDALVPFIQTIFLPILTGRPYLPERAAAETLWLNRLPPDDRARAFEAILPESGWAIAEASAVTVDPNKVDCPILCVAPLDDASTRPETYHAISDYLDADRFEYPGHGRWIFAEPGWQSVASDVRGWLATVAADRTGQSVAVGTLCASATAPR